MPTTYEPAEVPAWPVYAFEVQEDSGRVTVTGPVIPATEHADRGSAVDAVAMAAGSLGRPVRATATEPDGTVWHLVISPDGSVSELGGGQRAKTPKKRSSSERKQEAARAAAAATSAAAPVPQQEQEPVAAPASVPAPAPVPAQTPAPVAQPTPEPAPAAATATAPGPEPVAVTEQAPVAARTPSAAPAPAPAAAPAATTEPAPAPAPAPAPTALAALAQVTGAAPAPAPVAETAPLAEPVAAPAHAPTPAPAHAATPAPVPNPAQGPVAEPVLQPVQSAPAAPVSLAEAMSLLDTHLAEGRTEHAVGLAAQLDDRAARSFGLAHPDALYVREERARVMALAGDPAGALRLYRDVAERWLYQGAVEQAEAVADRAQELWFRTTDLEAALSAGVSMVRMRNQIPGQGGRAFAAVMEHQGRLEAAWNNRPAVRHR